MMSIKFSWDHDAMERFATDVVAKVATEYDAILEEVYNTCAGQPVERVKPVLARCWAKGTGGRITEPELTQWSTLISEGTRIQFKASA